MTPSNIQSSRVKNRLSLLNIKNVCATLKKKKHFSSCHLFFCMFFSEVLFKVKWNMAESNGSRFLQPFTCAPVKSVTLINETFQRMETRSRAAVFHMPSMTRHIRRIPFFCSGPRLLCIMQCDAH